MNKSPSPNILVFFSDQQRWDTVGCYGQPLPITPNLDRLAREGVRFEHAFTCQPVCGPARACIQTGKYATEVGCHVNHRMLPIHETTIAKLLRGNGYETAYIGKWHLASCGPRNGLDDFTVSAVPPERRGGYGDYWLAADALEHTSHGYDGYMYNGAMERVDFKGYRADCETDFVIDYLQSRTSKKPFFLFASYLEPHHQNDHNRYEGPDGSKELFRDYPVPGDLEGTQGDWRENYPDYLGCCERLDFNLGRIVATLKRLGQYEDTVIVYTSDHGSHFRTRNGEYKRSCHESSIRIPMVIRGGPFVGGPTVRELVSLIDLPPSLLALAGMNAPSSMRGKPMQPLAEGKAENWPDEVFFQISESHTGRGIRTRKWKYAVAAPYENGMDRAGSDVYHEAFLYDLDADPYEKNNLVDDPAFADVRGTLAAVLKKRMEQAGETVPAILPAAR